jgi:hypothetical protein
MEPEAMTQTILTFITKVKPEHVNDLRKLLDQIGKQPEANALMPFRSLKRVHFASFVLHQSSAYGAYLIFENNFDGVLDDYLTDLCSQAANGLHQIYSCCQDYSTAASNQTGILNYLRAHAVRPNAYHIGNTGRDAARILQEKALRTALEQECDRLIQNGQATSEPAVFASLQNFVRSDPQWSWVPGVGPRETFAQKLSAWFKLIAVAVLLLAVLLAWLKIALLGIVWIPIIAWVLMLRYKERTDAVQADSADSDNLQKLMDAENRTASVQNHMCSITIVKPGWLRRTTLRAVLWAVNLQARALATHGTLSGIPSIHFAHWSMIDKGRRLLFLSNFDGSWENYLDDFIDKASAGLTGVWSNTLNFPRTYFLIFGGATDGPRFKAVARDSQIVTNVWYSAYWDLTVQGVDNNSSIREDLLKPLDATAASAFLRRM